MDEATKVNLARSKVSRAGKRIRSDVKTKITMLLDAARIKLKPGALDTIADTLSKDKSLVALVGAMDYKNDEDVALFKKIVKGKRALRIENDFERYLPGGRTRTPTPEPARRDPVAEVLRKAFEIAKKWNKTWTTETKQYDIGFGLVKNLGVFLMVQDKESGEKVFFKTQATGLTPDEMSKAIKDYRIRFRDMNELIKFASKKEGKGIKGRKPKKRMRVGGRGNLRARQRQKVPGKEDPNK